MHELHLLELWNKEMNAMIDDHRSLTLTWCNCRFVNFCFWSIQLEEGVHLLGAFSEMEVTEQLKNAILNCSGEKVLGWCQAFKRVLIKVEVFHSKSYGHVFRRNSYTVTYEDNNCDHRSQCNCKTAYGQVQHFIKHTPACQNACVALCKCNREQ